MRDINELNIKSKPGPRPSLQDWSMFEKTYAVVVPELIRSLICLANGSGMELNSIVPEGGRSDQRLDINHFLHLKSGDNGPRSLMRVMDEWRPMLGTNGLPFAKEGGGDLFFLDLALSPAPVKIWQHDPHGVMTVASSLEALIDRLEVNPDAI